MSPVEVTRTSVRLLPDPTRVITKRFGVGGGVSVAGSQRIQRIVARILALPETEVITALQRTWERFATRHRDLRAVFQSNYSAAMGDSGEAMGISPERRLLIGAYFTNEYSVEASALSNPSVVLAPNQDGLTPGATRFVMSLRAIGEGHISSIEFRTGVIDAAGEIEMEATAGYVDTARHHAPVYEKELFHGKLVELRAYTDLAAAVLDGLPERFTLGQLEARIRKVDHAHVAGADAARATRTLHWLASSNYESSFDPASRLCERILFPAGPTESNGMEDARFVRFIREDLSATYYATYTAFDGYQILPQLIETDDFLTFRTATLNGDCAKNKGIALFPRKVNGRYAALARLDNENNFLMWSNNVRFWHESHLLQQPKVSWEITQLGNCGAPLETEAGWLVITHGVGMVRQYSLGAILLDKEDPQRVIGHLAEPLLEAASDERDGYVPNVVYSCGSMIVGPRLVVPYGYSDVGTRIATVRLDDLLGALTSSNKL